MNLAVLDSEQLLYGFNEGKERKSLVFKEEELFFHELLEDLIKIDSEFEFWLSKTENHQFLINQFSNEITQIAIFEELRLSKILLVHWLRLSYHDTKPVPVICDITFGKHSEIGPYVKVLKKENEKLKVIHCAKMHMIEKTDQFFHFSCFENSSVELSLKIFSLKSQTAFYIQDHYQQVLLTFTSAEIFKESFQSLYAFVELLCLKEIPDQLKNIVLKKAKHQIEQIDLFEAVQKEAISFLNNDPAALFSLIQSRSKQESINESLFIKPILAEPYTAIEIRAQKIREKGNVWAYDIPEIINKVVDTFRKEELNVQKPAITSNFVELDLDPRQSIIDPKTGILNYNKGELIPAVDDDGNPRAVGLNKAGIIIGIQTDDLGLGYPVRRLLIIGDISHSSRGVITAEECARINAAIRLAERIKIPIDWFPASHGVEIQLDRGVESLDASASTIREIVHSCHHSGVQINLIINETNIGAQSYWDALAAILFETSGVLIMTPKGSMALTGHNALVAAIHNKIHSEDISSHAKRIYPHGIKSLSSYSYVHGPNGDAMAFAKDVHEACQILIRHHYYTYLKRKEVMANHRPIKNSQISVHECELLIKEVQKLLKGQPTNRELILEALRDKHSPKPVRYWADAKGIRDQPLKNGDFGQLPTVIVQEMLIGGFPTMVIFTPVGPLTPADSEIIGRAFYKARNLQILVIGSLTGFNCDPLSMENHQLGCGALIAKAIVEHKGPILVVNMGNLVGGTFVVFSKQLNPHLRILAVEGSHVQVIGGNAAAKVVFHSRICKQAEEDPRIKKVLKFLSKHSKDIGAPNKWVSKFARVQIQKFQEGLDAKRREVIEEIEKKEGLAFDEIHNVQRALKVGSIDAIIPVEKLCESIMENLKSNLDFFITNQVR